MVLVTNSTKNFGQYFTPKFIADFMVSLITHSNPIRILEPSAGTGIFLEALKDKFSNIVAIELDSTLTSHSAIPILYQNFFDYPVEEKFQVIIGNPPYIRWRNQPDEIRNDIIQRNFWNNRLNALADILQAFIFKSIDHLTDGGELIFITPKFWLQTLHAANLREFIIKAGYVDLIIDCQEKKIFSSVSSNLIIFKFIKAEPPSKHKVKVFSLLEKESITKEELNFIYKMLKEPNTKQKEEINLAIHYYQIEHPISSQSWNLFPKKDEELVSQIELSCKTHYTITASIRNGLKDSDLQLPLLQCVSKQQLENYSFNLKQLSICSIGKRKLYFIDQKIPNFQQFIDTRYVTISDIFQIGNGMVSGLDKAFWIRNNKNDPSISLKFNAKEQSLLRDVIKARNMNQYKVNKYATYIFIQEQDFPSEQDFQEQCPNLYNRLIPFKEDLERRWSPKPIPWYIWSFPRNFSIFLQFKHKFFLPCKERFDNKGFIRCVYDANDVLGVQDITVLGLYSWVRESPEYLLAYLNSKILFKWLIIKGLKRGGVLQFSEHPLSTIPVRLINWNNQQEVNLHNQIKEQVTNLLSETQPELIEKYKEKINDLLQTLVFKN